MKQYDTVIIGSGFGAAAIAEQAKSALIVDAHFLLDPEYSGTFFGYEFRSHPNFSQESAELRRIFEDCGALKEDAINVPCAELCLSEYIVRRGIDVLLGASLIEVARKGDGYVVKLQSSAGQIEVGARRVVERPTYLPDRIRFLMRGKGENIARLSTGDVTFTASKAFYDDEFILTVGVREPMNQNALKALAVRALSDAVRDTDVRIIACAENGYSSRFPHACADPISAFEKGLADEREGLQ